MQLSSFNNPDEFGKIAEYLKYIGKRRSLCYVFLAICQNECLGLSDDPVFALTSETNVVLSSEKPAGRTEGCLVQQGGILLNASCDQKSHFVCKERPLPDGMATTM
jgi:hypothetical protein